MTFELHCRECQDKLGRPFSEVHRWLDEFFPTLTVDHRRKRHHLAGIRECAIFFGDEAAQAAQLHIISDLKEDGRWESGDRIPENEEDYINRGLL